MSNNELALENPRKAVAAVGTELDKMPTPPPDQQAKETWERLVQVVNFVNARLAGTDPALVPVAQANNLNSQLTVLLNATRAFLANASTWRNLEGPLDNTLNAIVAIPPMGAGEASQHYVTAFNEFMRRRDEAIKAAEDRAAAMEKRSKDLQASVKETEKRRPAPG